MKWLLRYCCCGRPRLWGDAGVLIPSTAKQPDPKVLTLDEMSIAIVIDNGNAKVKVQQIFSNHTGAPIEGNYVFALPGRALISDFAIWDDVTRIPGVILERKRAEEIYNDIRDAGAGPGAAANGRARCRRSSPQRDFQRSRGADSGVWHEAPRDGISGAAHGGAGRVDVRDSAAAGRVSRADGR